VNRKAYVLISIILAAISGWGLGYIRLPYIEKEYSFGVGVLTALAIIGLTTLLTYLLKTKKSTGSSRYSKNSFWLILTCITTAAVCIFLYQKTHTQQNKIETQSNLIVAQSEAIIVLEQRNLMALVATVLSAADVELAQSSTRSLSQATIDRIADLSHSLKPYRQVTKDSIISRESSKERGQLLLSLTKMNINSASFAQIKKLATFEYADLRDAHLANMDLSGINLSRANLEGATLSMTRLDSANLFKTNFLKVQFASCSLIKANLDEATLDWANMSNSNLTRATLEGTSIRNANLRAAIIVDAFLKYADLTGSVLNESNCSRSIFHIVNFSQVNFSDAVLTDINMIRADLSDATFTQATVSKDWYAMLDAWETGGIDQIKSTYKVALEKTLVDSIPVYKLVSKKQLVY
jgi:uncharacterized protein YjbI with pentapeptide repeats